MTDSRAPRDLPVAQRNAQIVQLREAGKSWAEIQEAFGLSRQQARHAYQVGKREERKNRPVH